MKYNIKNISGQLTPTNVIFNSNLKTVTITFSGSAGNIDIVLSLVEAQGLLQELTEILP